MTERLTLISPNIPDWADVCDDFKKIWQSGFLTNHGPVEQSLESELTSYTGVNHALTCVNGTFAISLALSGLDLTEGEVITTPFSWISSASAIIQHGLTPNFVDICPSTLNIDVKGVEKAISDKTVAILAVHTFGNPCNVAELARISKKHGIPLIYDAAHAMGTKVGDRSVLTFGDVSTTSFHATKIVGCGEGGAIFTQNSHYASNIREYRSFGFNDQKQLKKLGSNNKFNEISALIAMRSLQMINESINTRKHIHRLYKARLDDTNLCFQMLEEGANYSYFPIIFKSEDDLHKVQKALSQQYIDTRRYFHPSLDSYDLISKKSKNLGTYHSTSISQRILILPCHNQVSDFNIQVICDIVNG